MSAALSVAIKQHAPIDPIARAIVEHCLRDISSQPLTRGIEFRPHIAKASKRTQGALVVACLRAFSDAPHALEGLRAVHVHLKGKAEFTDPARRFAAGIYGECLLVLDAEIDSWCRRRGLADTTTMKQGRPNPPAGGLSESSQDEAAKLLGVSTRTVQRARRVKDQGVPELVAAVPLSSIPHDGIALRKLQRWCKEGRIDAVMIDGEWHVDIEDMARRFGLEDIERRP